MANVMQTGWLRDDATGAVVLSTVAPLAAHRNGLPVAADRSMVITDDGTVTHFQNSLPRESGKRVAVIEVAAAVAPLRRQNSWLLDAENRWVYTTTEAGTEMHDGFMRDDDGAILATLIVV